MHKSKKSLSLITTPIQIPLAVANVRHKSLLAGPPQTRFLRSGQVTLALGDSVSLHSTLEGEKLIIPLSGSGQLTVPEMEPLPVEAGSVLYNPPRTWHRVSNTGTKPLVYLYVCAVQPDETNRVESSNM